MNAGKNLAAAIKQKLGHDPKHLSITKGIWILELWDRHQHANLLQNNNNLLNNLDNLHNQIAAKQLAAPVVQQVIAGDNKLISTQKQINILTNTGMTEMAKRSTGQTNSTNTHHAVGTGTTSETVNDTTLETETARKAVGSRVTVNQTERYATAFTDTELTVGTVIAEASIQTAAAAGIMIARVTGTPVTITAGSIFTVQTNISHQNGTEITE